MMKTHIERGFSLPPSDFMSEVLQHYVVNPQHLSPNNILILSGYQALSEGYLGVRPTLELFMYYYMVKRMPVDGNVMRTCGSICFKIRNDRRYPEVPGHMVDAAEIRSAELHTHSVSCPILDFHL